MIEKSAPQGPHLV